MRLPRPSPGTAGSTSVRSMRASFGSAGVYANSGAVGILSRARERLPGACWPVRMLYTVAQRHGDGTREAGLAEDIRRCDALSDTAVNVYTRMRRYADAARELDRLLVDDPEGRGLRRSLMELARARGDIEESVRRGAALLEAMPEDDTLRADLADLLVATGQRDRARAMLDRELSRNPAELSGLFRLRSLLAGVEDLDPWRLDGATCPTARRWS